MLKIGAHISISGGWVATARRALDWGCESLQIFTRSPRGGPARAIDPEEVKKMHAILEGAGVGPLLVHAPYYINLASEDRKVHQNSIRLLREEMQRGADMGAAAVITHIGSRPGEVAQALAVIASAIVEAIGERDWPLRLLLENTAGSGNELGWSFDQLQALLEAIDNEVVVGVCFDTAHAHGAGYDMSSRENVRRVFSEFKETIGSGRLHAVHFNNTAIPVGSKRDRHANLLDPDGMIDSDATGEILSLLGALGRELPVLMETPGDPGQRQEDLAALKALRP